MGSKPTKKPVAESDDQILKRLFPKEIVKSVTQPEKAVRKGPGKKRTR